MGLETLLKNTYNEQLELVRKSLQDNDSVNGEPPPPTTTTVAAAEALTKTTTQNNDENRTSIKCTPRNSITKKANSNRIGCGIQYTHRSRKFRFTPGEKAAKSLDTSITDIATSPLGYSTASMTNISATDGDSSYIVDDNMLGDIASDKTADFTLGLKETAALASEPNDEIKCSIMPPPKIPANLPKIEGENEAQASMLMSWYMAGYHTGYYEAMKQLKKEQQE